VTKVDNRYALVYNCEDDGLNVLDVRKNEVDDTISAAELIAIT